MVTTKCQDGRQRPLVPRRFSEISVTSSRCRAAAGPKDGHDLDQLRTRTVAAELCNVLEQSVAINMHIVTLQRLSWKLSNQRHFRLHFSS